MMKNILLIMPYGSVGGMERLALTFYNYYKSEGYNVKALKFIKLNNDIINFGDDELFIKPYDFADMSKQERLSFYLKAPTYIRKTIKKHKITHSIAFGDMANLFSALTFTNEYKIGSIHALKSVELTNKTFFNSLTRIGYTKFYGRLNKLVCISKAIKEDLISKCDYKFSNLEVIYNPHNTQDIVDLSKVKIEDVEEQKIFSKKTVLFLGRLSVQKSPWHLIKAFKLVQAELKDVNLVLIGDGDKSVIQYIKTQIKEFNLTENVCFLGRKNNPYKYINASNVLVLSSHYEGTPNVIVESIAIGTPIVSSFCTKGIIELMSTKEYKETQENIILESGIVTPNLFKGVLGLPKDTTLTNEEVLLSKALIQVLENDSFKLNLNEHKIELLTKFDLNFVANQYLKHLD
ncbi:glycosyltransferase [Tamlana agarivorans]|uniref:Glycosyltransferase n=1 Tax=Pseudotamlana agarivorans TaxID=481183 RepID=A0ACC5UA09_9FLAO|nr:glycosyltransferase [Tamlana agarivorans]MBU2951159.1 glycosyltransferase [Tamlana agarivorans]